MYIIKQGLNKKEKKQIQFILGEVCDLYSDFYVTKNNVRIPLRDNPEVLFDYLRKGDRIVYEIDGEKGLGLVTGWSDKSSRIYVKVLTKDLKSANNFLKIINWNIFVDLYCKLKKNNPLSKIFLRNGYVFKGDRGSEILLCREYKSRPKKNFENKKDE